MNRIASQLSIAFLLTLSMNAAGQNVAAVRIDDEERRAQTLLNRGDFMQAIAILTDALTKRPSVETFVALGSAYRRNHDWQKAEDLLADGEELFPEDPRIPTELANAYLDAGDVEGAREALVRALQIEPANVEAADLMAAVELSVGEVQSALRFWNRSGHPIVNKVLHNSNLSFDHWTVRAGHAFHPGEMMTYTQWRTTQRRLLETNIFSNVGINIEPDPASSRFNPIILTTARTNDLANAAFSVVKGAPLKTSYFDWWDIGHSGINLNSSFRWDYNRRRGEVQLHAPIPAPGILFLNATGLWRSERWDLAPVLRTGAGKNDRLHYKSTGMRVEFKYLPYYRFDFGGGFEYANRAADGGLPQLATDSRNSGKVTFQGSVRLADSRYQNRFHLEGFVANKSLLGDLNYSAATLEMNNQLLISKQTNTVFIWTIRGGASRGSLPVEDYFVLGLDTHAGNLLRAHPAARRGLYGNAPMGTSFALSNMDIERRIAILPLFNTLNLPYLDVKAQLFLDSGKTFDRTHIFKQGKLHIDSGAGLKFETPTHSLNLIYGRSLREGKNVLFAYIEKRW